mmetsp:Transcript_115718/g.322365  ORF Transcript_115718/g.322365 Transcript_115718/m.322365 type:complete len:147 (-) Transcript_115718:221-661(-)
MAALLDSFPPKKRVSFGSEEQVCLMEVEPTTPAWPCLSPQKHSRAFRAPRRSSPTPQGSEAKRLRLEVAEAAVPSDIEGANLLNEEEEKEVKEAEAAALEGILKFQARAEQRRNARSATAGAVSRSPPTSLPTVGQSALWKRRCRQ